MRWESGAARARGTNGANVVGADPAARPPRVVVLEMVKGQGVAGDARSAGRSRAPLIAFGVVEAVLLTAALVVPFPVGGLCNMLAMLIGLVVATVRVVRVRPQPGLAWGLVVTTGWTLVLGAVVASVVYGLEGGINVNDPASLLISAVPFVTLGAALGLFSRVAPHRGSADIVDALMVALAGFLVLWTVWLGATFNVNVAPVIVVAILPFGVLVLVTLGVKLALGGGARDAPVAFVLAGAAALSGATLALLIPGVGQANLPVSPVVNLLWGSFGAAIGAAALHPGFNQPRTRSPSPVNDTSMPRTVLFALLALVPLASWANEAEQRRSVHAARPCRSRSRPCCLVLLVARMGLVSRIAHERATAARPALHGAGHRRVAAAGTAEPVGVPGDARPVDQSQQPHRPRRTHAERHDAAGAPTPCSCSTSIDLRMSMIRMDTRPATSC